MNRISSYPVDAILRRFVIALALFLEHRYGDGLAFMSKISRTFKFFLVKEIRDIKSIPLPDIVKKMSEEVAEVRERHISVECKELPKLIIGDQR